MNNGKLIGLTDEDLDLVIFLASAKPCSLETAPGNKDNWIERTGPRGKLPNYICVVAKGIMKSGKTRSAAIAIAISKMKKWAAGLDNVNADTRAKAAKAVAQWEALKAKNKAKKLVKASTEQGDEYIILSEVDSYSLNEVRAAWDSREKAIRDQLYELRNTNFENPYNYSYVVEVYTDYIIVEREGPSRDLEKVGYHFEEDKFVFGTPEPVKLQYVNKEETWVRDATRQ